ncbi:MAG: type IV pilus biogenesis/stability protein PilW [Oceanococcus sp.]
MIRTLLFTFCALLLSACVQTGDTRFKPDLQEAARLNTQLGLNYMQQGNYELALSKLQKALEQDDSNADTHWGLALAHERFKEFQKAEDYFRVALKLAPKDAGIRASYGQYLCSRDDLEGAMASFDKALSMPRYLTPEVALTNAGSCYRQNNQRVPAEQKFRRALEYNPRYSRALMQLADMSFEGGDYLRSRAFIQRVESVGAESADSLLLGLRTEYALGDQRAVRRYANALREMMPDIGNRIDLNSGKAW